MTDFGKTAKPSDPTCRRIAILNSKGGSGKTTLATNLAAMLTALGQSAALFDYDKQGSSTFWLKKRHDHHADIVGVEAYRTPPPSMTRTWFLRVPPGTCWQISDTPAGLDDHALRQFVAEAHYVLIPVMPSPSDIHAATRFIERLLIAGRVKAARVRVGVVANRVKLNMDVYRNLRLFLDALNLPVVAQIRDSHHYLQAAMDGKGVRELSDGRKSCDNEEWEKLLRWLTVESVSPSKKSQSSGRTIAAGALVPA